MARQSTVCVIYIKKFKSRARIATGGRKLNLLRTGVTDREFMGSLVARHSAAFFISYNRELKNRAPTGGRRLNLLPGEQIESFWEAGWLGIQPSLCFTIEN